MPLNKEPKPNKQAMKVSALQSVVASSISSGGDYGIHC